MDEFISKHKLVFEVGPWDMAKFFPAKENYQRFRVGTVEGLFGFDDDNYYILALQNNELHNGHFDDVLEWFENSCKRDKKNLVIQEVWNPSLKLHLIKKRGFSVMGKDNVIKKFKH